MKSKCQECKIREYIEIKRYFLDKVIEEKQERLLDEEIIRLSKELDKHICKCVFCSTNINILKKKRILECG